MFRLYEMCVEVSGFNPEKKDAIINEANEEWPNFDGDWFDPQETNPDADASLSSHGEDCLCGGETEEEFTDRLSRAIWKANGGFCPVSVVATNLEYIPCERHDRGEDDYDRIMEG